MYLHSDEVHTGPDGDRENLRHKNREINGARFELTISTHSWIGESNLKSICSKPRTKRAKLMKIIILC